MAHNAAGIVYPPIISSALPTFEVDHNAFWTTYPDYQDEDMDVARKDIARVAKRYYHDVFPRQRTTIYDYCSESFSAQLKKRIFGAYPPTQLVAVVAKPANPKFFPIHHFVFAANCAKFPQLLDVPPDPIKSEMVTLPVSAIVLRSPTAFSILWNYLYSGNINRVYRQLVLKPLDERKAVIRGFWETLFDLEVVDRKLYDITIKAWDECLWEFQLAMPQLNGSPSNY
ncbi:hypothetical protein D9615_005923 [Tricholomella constricta]|uniref:BTB domain-containing protein n=1 Tax=Tricholomella constricta TaxID=117010 RepID=A0A8H5M3F2_9AGAR|nr:hypothetical protein D9615_005923 [Tricholomella constricta]